MRRFLAFAVLLAALASSPLGAEEGSVLFEPTSQIPAEGGPGAKIAFFPDGAAFLSGGVGAVSIGHGVELGVGGYSLASEYVPSHDGVTYDVGYSYLGLLMAYTFFRHSLVSVNTSFLAGPAQGWSVAREANAVRTYSNFGQIEPCVDLMLNVTPQLRLGLGASWRFCAGSDLDGVLGTNLNGGALSFLMMYGQN